MRVLSSITIGRSPFRDVKRLAATHRANAAGVMGGGRAYGSLATTSTMGAQHSLRDAFASAAPGLAGLGEPPAPPAPDLLAVHAVMVAAATNTAAHYEARSGEPFDATGLVSAVGTALLRSLRGVPPELIARTRFLAVPIRPVAAEIMREGEKEAALTATPL